MNNNQRLIFSKNLNYYLEKNNKTQKEVADAINVIPSTFNTWCQGIALPRMEKLQALADYFHINKSDLIEEKEFSTIKESESKKIMAKIYSIICPYMVKQEMKYVKHLE